MKRTILIGYDPREHIAYEVAMRSMLDHASPGLKVGGIVLGDMRQRGLYWRRHERRGGQLWDEISAAPMSTEFAISRFLVRHLAGSGWVLFTDCDVLWRADPAELFKLADPGKALMCVHHRPQAGGRLKMDGQAQWAYLRKNWSSVMLINCDHPSNAALTPELVNTLPGRELHRFAWLRDDEIGALPPEWNHLVGVDSPRPDAELAHFTLGIPEMAGHEGCEFADEWREVAARCRAPA